MRLRRVLGLFSVPVIAFPLILLIAFRSLGLPDDFEYLVMFNEINDDFHGASEKYGVIFKAYIVFVGSVMKTDVLLAFALIPALLAIVFVWLGRGNLAFGFVGIITSMPVVWFVQMRQALALVFVLALVLAGRRSLQYLFSIMACLSHLSVMPFIVWYFFVVGAKSIYLKSKKINATLSIIFVISTIAFIDNIEIISLYTGFHFNVLISDEALNYGRLGAGLVLIFYFHVVCVKVYGLLSENVMFSILSIGSAILLVSYFMPLLQRLLLPFVLYLVVVFYSSSRVDFLHKLLGFALLGVFLSYKIIDLTVS